MSLRTKTPTSDDKYIATEDLRKKHEILWKSLGVADALFIPKMNYYYSPLDTRVVSFFESELRKGRDIYIEFVDRYFNPEDKERRLYKWEYNPDWEIALEKEVVEEKGFTKYLVKVSEFSLVMDEALNIDEDKTALKKVWEIMNTPINTEDTITDLPLTELTFRDIYSIIHNKPCSNKEWINRFIKENQ